MISVEEAISKILTQEITHQVETLNTLDALGFVLAEDVLAPISLPSFPQSAMDGYAVKGFHKEYQLVGEIQAGKSKNTTLVDGTAIRIFTGAVVPCNATAVIMQEKVVVDNDVILVNDIIVNGKNIRPIGEQLKQNELVFAKGEELNASSIGLLVSFGIQTIHVYQKPKISIISTGNELVELGNPLEYGQVYESNTATLINAAKTYHYTITSTSKVNDDYQSTVKQIDLELKKCSVLLITGGISVGDYDFVGKSLEELGVQQLFYKVAQKPGKPLFFGKKDNKFIFALPGNPAAALTCFYMYVLPLLNRISNKSKVQLPKIELPLKETFLNNTNKSLFLKAFCNEQTVELLEGQASSMIYAFSKANAIIYVPSDKKVVEQNEKVEVYLL